MVNRSKLASILTIGTEITSGEIINGNAASIARRLVDQGYIVDLHISVADDRPAIQKALNICTSSTSLVIVTGGLGPTTDDFTREEISKFIDRPLQWDDSSWQHILTRLRSLNAPIAESNKQQCWFPEGSEVLKNREGTAAGFAYNDEKKNCELIVLPGPPKEIDAIWQDHVDARLRSRVAENDRLVLKRWITMGLSESRLGEIVESALEGSNLTTGYRSRIPYIDVKVWIPVPKLSEFASIWEPKLESIIQEWLVGKENEDIAASVWSTCPSSSPIMIIDHATCGLIASRLYEQHIPTGKQIHVLTCDRTSQPLIKASSLVYTIVSDIDSGAWSITCNNGETRFSEVSRYKSAAHQQRLKSYICERSLQLLASWWA